MKRVQMQEREVEMAYQQWLASQVAASDEQLTFGYTTSDVRLFVTIVRHILMRPNAPLLTSCDRYALTQFMLDTSSATCAPFATGILQLIGQWLSVNVNALAHPLSLSDGCASCTGGTAHSPTLATSRISRPYTIGR